MLAGFSFGMPRQSKTLKSVATRIETEANAQQGTVKASMHYFRQKVGNRESDGLSTLKTFQVAWKTALDQYARYPFASGMKILPAGLVQDFITANQSFEQRKEEVINNWIRTEYPQWLDSAPSRMGTLFDPVDFPSADDCRRRFTCNVTVVPLAAAEQWQRIAIISPSLAQTMAATQNEAVQRATQQAHGLLWRDVLAPIQNIVEQLSKDKTKIHASLLENVKSIVALIPAYNEIHHDQNLTALAASMSEMLATVTVEDLRTSAEAKAEAMEKAKEMVEKFEPYARSFDLDED